MSRENVERFHRIYEEWYARRKLGPDLLAEDVEWVNPHDAVEPGIRQGADSFNEAITSVFEAGGSLRNRARHRQRRRGGCVGQVRGRGRAAGIEVARPHGEIWTSRDGRVIRMRWFHSQSETLEAAELSE
jgi:ketosteroid isomerase-like protein